LLPFDHTRVIPVFTPDRLTDVVPVVEALLEGGLETIEITLRSPQSLKAIEAAARALPQARIGAAGVMRPGDVTAAVNAGAHFLVSPGLTPDLVATGRASSLPYIPGVATPSEIMLARDMGFSRLGWFPATALGGPEALALLAPLFPGIVFCPVGGITEAGAGAWLALPNVAAICATWIADPAVIEAHDWAGIRASARRARSLAAG